MSITSDAIQISNDAALLHQIINGDATTSVTTEGGPVKTIAHAIQDVVDTDLNVGFGGGADFDRLAVSGVVIPSGPHLTGPRGPAGVYSPGAGISIVGDAITNTGVTSLQGRTGDVTLTTGDLSASAGSVLLGRGSTGAGALQELTLGTGLAIAGTILSCTVSAALTATYVGFGSVGGILTGSADLAWNNSTKVLSVAGSVSQVSSTGFTTVQASTQDGINIVGRSAGNSSRVVTITPSALATSSRTFTLPDADGTATLGTGSANQMAYWSGANTVTGASWFTYASTSGANTLTHTAGTSTATTTGAMFSRTGTFSGIFTTGPVSLLSNVVTYSGATATASVILTNGYFATTSTGAITNSAGVSASVNSVTATPGGATTTSYVGESHVATVTGAANVFFAGSTLMGSYVGATFNTANTTGAAVAAAVVGEKIVPSIQTTNASSTNTLASAYGLWVAPGTWAGAAANSLTVANYYGLYLDTLTLTNMAVTNRYGVYQADTSAKNFFGGGVGIGADTSSSWGSLYVLIPGGTTNKGFTVDNGTQSTTSGFNTNSILGTFSGVQSGGATQRCLNVSLTSAAATTIGTTVAGGFTNNANASVLAGAARYVGSQGSSTTGDSSTLLYSTALLFGVQGYATFLGSAISGTSLDQMFAVSAHPSVVMAQASGSTTINTVASFSAQPGTFSTATGGTATTITTYYGLHLGSVSTSGSGTTTITNNYGVYQADTTAKNYFAGKVGVGVAPSSTIALNVTPAVGSQGIVVNTATQTTSQPMLSMAQTWNAGAVTFTGCLINISDTASAQGSKLLDLQVGGNARFMVTKEGRVAITGAALSGMSPAPVLAVSGGAHTLVTTGTERNDIYFILSRTVQWATSVPSTQRAVFIEPPTYDCNTAAQTITNAATVAIFGAPSGTANVTITNSYALWVQAGVSGFAGDVKVTLAGKGLFIKEGTNARMGTAVLVGGTVTVSTTAVNANSRIFLQCLATGGTRGFLAVTTVTNGTSFVITSSSGTDTSTVSWLIIDAA